MKESGEGVTMSCCGRGGPTGEAGSHLQHPPAPGTAERQEWKEQVRLSDVQGSLLPGESLTPALPRRSSPRARGSPRAVRPPVRGQADASPLLGYRRFTRAHGFVC